MNYDAAKRVVALTRQKKSYNAMVKSGDISRSEADALIAQCDSEIALVRSQTALVLSPAPAPKGAGKA